MGDIKSLLEIIQKLGINNEFLITLLVCSILAYQLQKYFKTFKKNLSRLSEVLENKILKKLENIEKNTDQFNSKCTTCEKLRNDQHTDSEVQQGTLNEKVDNLEDHVKEIKKKLLFK